MRGNRSRYNINTTNLYEKTCCETKKTLLDGNLSGANDGRWIKPMAIDLEERESIRKHIVGLSEVRDNVERGTEGGMLRENVEL